jgi:hypothetical protein
METYMKEKAQRPLAYQVARAITSEEINTVGGGGNNTCQQLCMQASGSNSSNWDAVVDYTIDF